MPASQWAVGHPTLLAIHFVHGHGERADPDAEGALDIVGLSSRVD
jgi:hypothetical protein